MTSPSNSDIYQCSDRPNLSEKIQDEQDQLNYAKNNSSFDYPSLLTLITAIILIVILFIFFNKTYLTRMMLLLLIIFSAILVLIIIRNSWTYGKYSISWTALIIFAVVATLAVLLL